MVDGKPPLGLFTTLYQVSGYLAAIMIIILFIVSLIDIGTFSVAEISENIGLKLNPNLFIKDGIDFETLKYSRNKPEEEPYNIFRQQQIVGTIYWLFGGIIVVVFLDVIVTISMFIIDIVKKTMGLERDEEVDNTKYFGLKHMDIITKPFFVIILMFVLAISYSSYYTSSFLKNIQPDLINTGATIKNITKLIYDNLSTNEEFLKSVVDENMNDSYKIINKQGGRPDTIGSMIFTLSLYNYYKMNTDILFLQKIKEIFTTKQIRLRTIIPIEYMYYDQNAFIPNLYPSIERFLKNVEKKDAVRNNVSGRLRDVNRLLVSSFRMKVTRSNIRMYMIMSFIITLLFTVLVGFIYSGDIIDFVKTFRFNKNIKIITE